MDASIQRDKAVAFRQMHAGPRILVLPNAWDVASAHLRGSWVHCRCHY
jgi:2-methylisocitrate lyase-like PEP mutase family enzyme